MNPEKENKEEGEKRRGNREAERYSCGRNSLTCLDWINSVRVASHAPLSSAPGKVRAPTGMFHA